MEKKITFAVKGKTISETCPLHWSSNTVDYIKAGFVLDDEWKSCDVVRAAWSGRQGTIITLLDADDSCVVPHEVLAVYGKVSVNLYGVKYDDDGEEFTRITTAPVTAIIIDSTARIDGSETVPVTPSQFEQFVQAVKTETEKVTGMTAVAETLPTGSDATASYSDGVLTLGLPRGDKGDAGERGEPGATGPAGATGNGIQSITKTGTSGLVDTYTILFTDGTSTTFTVTNGQDGSGAVNSVNGKTGDVTLTASDVGALPNTMAIPSKTSELTNDSGFITAELAPVQGVKGSAESAYRTGNVSISKENIGLGNVDNTSDADKPISTATQSALDQKVDKETGKGLSTNDFTNAEKTKLAGIEAGAQVNTITGVKGDAETDYRTGNVNITKENIGLGNVDNTSDLDKPISTATQTALDDKQDALTFDETPTADSENPVTSGGLYSLLEPVASEATGSSILATETSMNTALNTLLTRLVDAHLTTEAGDLIVQDLMQGNILLAQLARNIEESGVF